jgi:integrase/recombinase XerD
MATYPTPMEVEQFLRPDEFKHLLAATHDDRERCMLLLMAGAGLRVGEMVAIKVEDIDFSKRFLHIGAEHAKGGRPRTVVLMPPVIDAILKYLAERTQGWLFSGYKGTHITTVQAERILHSIAERAGLQKIVHPGRKGPGRYRVHPHLLRHSFAVWSLDTGVPVGDLQDQLGHASLATTGIYLKASPSHRREAYARSGLSRILV